MKNNLILKFSFFFIFFLNFLSAFSEVLKFEASSIEILDKDKIVIAENGVKIFSGDEKATPEAECHQPIRGKGTSKYDHVH